MIDDRIGIHFSDKQRLVLKWWQSDLYRHYDAIICDGAVRSGKSTVMSISFALWGMTCFDNCSFGICGKTITSVKRNVIVPLIATLERMNMLVTLKESKNYFDVVSGGNKNRFYIFGGKDEGAASLIQGMTLAGVMIDEAALLPRSFTEQAIARCSVTGSKLWFDCNPEGAYHWFKREWIDKAEYKRALYLNFTLDDNPSLSREIKERYKRVYSGAFYERFVLGRWVSPEGLIYPMFDPAKHCCEVIPRKFTRYIVSCDYGTVNPTSFGLWGECEGIWYRISEYYFDSRKGGRRKTDEEHYAALERLCGKREIEVCIVDPSASSFIECIRRHGRYKVMPAKNDVLYGINKVSEALRSGWIKIFFSCKAAIREFSLYRWDEKGRDIPVKENDHAMDDIRYFVTYISGDKTHQPFFVMSLDRETCQADNE